MPKKTPKATAPKATAPKAPKPPTAPASPTASPISAPEAAPELQTVGFWPTFVYFFAGTTLIAAVTSAQALQVELTSGAPFQLGILFGLLSGFVGAYYNRTTKLEIAIPEGKDNAIPFNQSLSAAIQSIGYTPAPPTEAEEIMPGYELYRRAGLRHWLSGNLLLRRQPEQVQLYSRARIIRQLKKTLG
jgi:hypothetical protein